MKETECLINSPECVQAIQRHVDLILKENVTPTPEASSGIEGGLFRAGKLTAVWSYSGAHIFPPGRNIFRAGLYFLPLGQKACYGRRSELLGSEQGRQKPGCGFDLDYP